MKHRGFIYREFPDLSLSWWRVECTCGWTDLDLTEHRYAIEVFDQHLFEEVSEP